tara:strand:+ start:660 stop:815 length:156 start_codon:yes stop_codon:yes gene_type:complete
LARPNFQYEKRQRELAKKKKQEDKRQRKMNKTKSSASAELPPALEDKNNAE